MNTVILTGRITKDPELRQSQSGTATCSFSLAVDREYKQPGQAETDYPRILCFGKTAENLCQYQGKGSLIGVRGRIQTGSYEKNGQKVYTTDVIADRIEYLTRKSDSNSQRATQGYQQTGYGQNAGYGPANGSQSYAPQGYPQQGYPNYQNAPQQGQGYQNPGYVQPQQPAQPVQQRPDLEIPREDLPF